MTALGQRQRRYTIKQYREWEDLYKSGFSAPQIGRLLEIPPGTISNYLRRSENVEMRTGVADYTISRIPHKRYEQLYYLMHAQEMSPRQAGEFLGISTSTARRMARLGGFSRTRSESVRLAYRTGRKVPTGLTRI